MVAAPAQVTAFAPVALIERTGASFLMFSMKIVLIVSLSFVPPVEGGLSSQQLSRSRLELTPHKATALDASVCLKQGRQYTQSVPMQSPPGESVSVEQGESTRLSRTTHTPKLHIVKRPPIATNEGLGRTIAGILGGCLSISMISIILCGLRRVRVHLQQDNADTRMCMCINRLLLLQGNARSLRWTCPRDSARVPVKTLVEEQKDVWHLCPLRSDMPRSLDEIVADEVVRDARSVAPDRCLLATRDAGEDRTRENLYRLLKRMLTTSSQEGDLSSAP